LANKGKDETEQVSAVESPARSLLRFLVKELVDGKSLNWSILSLLRTSPELLRRHHRRWEEWEDHVVRDKYPRGGCLAVALFLNRTVTAIASRAYSLGIKRHPEKHRISNKDSRVREEGYVAGDQENTQRPKISDQRRLESQRVKEEKLRAKEKRWLEWKQIMQEHARIKEQMLRLRIQQMRFKTLHLMLREKRRIERQEAQNEIHFLRKSIRKPRPV